MKYMHLSWNEYLEDSDVRSVRRFRNSHLNEKLQLNELSILRQKKRQAHHEIYTIWILINYSLMNWNKVFIWWPTWIVMFYLELAVAQIRTSCPQNLLVAGLHPIWNFEKYFLRSYIHNMDLLIHNVCLIGLDILEIQWWVTECEYLAFISIDSYISNRLEIQEKYSWYTKKKCSIERKKKSYNFESIFHTALPAAQ